jgi:hypothetical protein
MRAAALAIPLVVALGGVAAIAGCSRAPQQPQAPELPPLQLRPMIAELKALAATVRAPGEAAQRELRDLGDVALQLVEADARTAARAERALLEHADAWWVLEPALAHDRVEVRRRAAWLCGRSAQGVLQLPLLLRLKYEQDPEAVVWVADALQQLGNDHGLAWLDAALATEATQQQAGTAAIGALRARGVTLSEQPTWEELRRELAAAGARWREHGEVTYGDKDGFFVLAINVGTVRTEEAFEPRFAAHLVTTEGTLLRPIDDAKWVLVRAGRLPVPLLARTLAAEEPYLRTCALELLGRIGPAAMHVAPQVLPLLRDPLTSLYAVRALGELGELSVAPQLRPLLGSIDTELRKAAAEALGMLRDQPSRDALRARLRDANEVMDVRVSAAFGLRCFGDDAEAEAFLAEREAKQDYHEPTLRLLRDRLAALPR